MKASVLKWELRKARFFDRPAVKQLAGVAHRVLERFGRFVRRDARTLLRKKGTKNNPHSRPGEPPHSGGKGVLRKWVLFDYDAREQSVVIGPEKLNMVFFNGDGAPVTGTVPEVLEYGGHIRILEVLLRVPRSSVGRGKGGRFETQADGFDEKWVRADLRSRRRLADKPTRLRGVDIAARPYMTPSFQKNLPHLRTWRAAA